MLMLGSSEAAVTVARSSVADLELTTDELEMRESETESSKAPPGHEDLSINAHMSESSSASLATRHEARSK